MAAQMPPPPGFPAQGQGFDPFIQFDVGGHDSDGDFGGDSDHGPQRNNSTKKNKGDKNKKNAQVEVRYEGFMLEKAPPAQVGETRSWSRVGRRSLPFGDAKLAEICKKSRLEIRMGPLTALTKLSSEQQGVVTRLIALRQLDEKNKDAEWVLECVRRIVDKSWRYRTKEVKEIMVILKRQDRNSTTVNQRVNTKGMNQYQPAEIIDLNAPMPKDKKNKGKKQKNDIDRDDDPWEGMGNGMMPDPFAGVGHGPQHDPHVIQVPPPHHAQHQPPHHQMPHPQDHHQQQMPPQGAIPIDQWQQQQHHQNGPMQMPHEGNPFQPNPQFNLPGQYEMPPNFDQHQRQNHFQTRSRTPNGGQRYSRSSSRDDDERRERRQRRDSQRLERRLSEFEDRFDDRINEVINKVDDWNIRESSSSEGSRDDVWSAQSGGSFTPPSSPPLSAVLPNGTLGRRDSKYYRRDSGRYRGETYYPRDGRRNSAQAVIEPYNNRSNRYGDGRRRSDVNRSPPRRRPQLHLHGHTWSGRDDYPGGPYAEREREPARRLTQSPYGEEYGYANFGGGRRRERDGRRERYYDDERRGGRRERAYYER